MRISDASHHLKKTSLWDYGNQADAEAVLTTTDILNKATATIRASLGVNNPENIWGSLGQHLEKHLLQLKAANIKNFGAFGFNQNNGLAFVQDPVFLHMTRLCLVSRKRGDLVAPALRHSEQVLDIDVNELAAEYLQNCSNDLVKAVISSVFAWVTAWAKDGQQMRLSFHPVGEWICDGESVDFRFSELFREGIALKKAAMEQQGAEIAETTDSGVGNMNDNQFDEQESLGDQTTCPPRSARNPVGTEELDYISAKNNLSVDIFPSAAKVSAVQSGSPVGRSRYKLRAPTFASIAKQLPPHGQRRKKRADASVEVVSSNSKGEVASKKKPSTDRGVARTVKQVGSATPGLNPIDIDTATEDILAAVRNIRPGTASTVRPCKSTLRSKPAPGPTAQQLDTINRLLKRISNRKSHSMQGLNAVVAVLKPFRTGAISPTELSLSLRKLGVKVSSGELKDVAAAFSHEKRGYIDITKLMDALRGPSLSGPRLDLVTRVFQQMDPAGSGVVDVDGMIKHYDVGFLDKVREGRQSKWEALTAFLQEWASVCNCTGNSITFEAFVRYYQNASACISSDAEFERLMHQAWPVAEEHQGPETESPSGGNNKNLSTNIAVRGVSRNMSTQSAVVPGTQNGTETTGEMDTRPSKAWSYLRALLLFPQPYQFGVGNWPTLDNMCRRLGANRVLGDGNEIMNAKAFSNSLATLDKRLTPKDAVDLSCFVADHCAPSLGNSDSIVLLSLYRMLTTVWSEKSTSDPVVDYNYVEYYASRAIERIRIRVNGSQTRTTHAEILPSVDLKALEKWLQAFSSNGDSLLMKYELRNGLMKVGIDISYQDLDYLFAYFDVDRQGYINYEPFLEALRSPSNMLPKLARHQEKSLTHAETKPENDAPLQQPAILKYTAAPQRTTRRGQQVAPQPNFRRRNLIHRAIWDQSTKKEKSDTSEEFDKLEMERRRRYQAARIIQTTFRAFRARHIAAQLRRKAAAKTYRVSTLALEHEQLLTKKKKANRTALPTAYGF